MDKNSQTPILEVKNLKQYFYPSRKFTVKAVDGISFKIMPGETYGLVGESGSGKSTTGRAIIRLYDPTDGQIIFEGEDITGKMSNKALKTLRTKMAMIFQDPMTALNPVKTVGEQIAEVIRLHQKCTREESKKKACEMLEAVGIEARRADEYPHQFSGGMKQRVVIAIALACEPQILLADEPTTALDVTIQAQVIEMMIELRRRYQMSIIFITHDLGIVAEVCDKVAIMYAGEIVEYGALKDIFLATSHPYTKGLFGSIPSLTKDVDRLEPIEGMTPNPAQLPSGCKFHPRCPYATEACSVDVPEAIEVSPGHFVRCHLCKSEGDKA